MGTDKEVILFEGIPHPVKCDKIRYYEDKRFTSRLLPKADVPTLSIKESHMISGKKVLGAAAVAGLAMSAAAFGQHASAGDAPVPAQEKVNVRGSDKSAASVVTQFAGYLTTLRNPEDITKEGLERGTSVPLGPIDSGARYRSDELGGGWHYFVEYFSGTKTIERNAALEFVNEHDEYANMSPVCGTDANEVRKALKQAGYEERESVGEIGNFLGWEYIRNNILISLVPQATVDGDGKAHLCVRSIRTTG